MQNNREIIDYTVGSLLSEARRKKNLSIQDVSDKILVQSKYLQSLENDDFSILSSNTHAKGFLSVYAKFLGLDTNQVLLLLNKQRLFEQKIPFKELLFSREKDSIFSNKKILWLLFGTFFIVFMIVVFYLFSNTPKKNLKKGTVQVLLSKQNPSHQFILSSKSYFSFVINDTILKYQLMNINTKSIVINSINDNRNFIIRSNEILKHDYQQNFIYDYMIAVDNITSNKVKLTVHLDQTVRLQSQNFFSTFVRKKSNLEQDAHSIFIKNNSSSMPIRLIISKKFKLKHIILSPLQTLDLKIIDEKGDILINSLTANDMSILYLRIHNQILVRNFVKGSVGMIKFKKSNSEGRIFDYELLY